MFSLRHGVFILALSAFGVCSAHDSDAKPQAHAPADPIVGLAGGVMSAFGVAPQPTPEPVVSPNISVDPQTGQAIYVPTGEVVDEVISVSATPVLHVDSPSRETAATETQRVTHSDGGAPLPTTQCAEDAALHSAT